MKKGNSNAKRNGYIGLGVMILLAGATVFGSDPLYKAIDSRAGANIYIPGTYTGSAKGYGGTVTVEVTVSGKSIESIHVNGEKETLLNMVLPGLTDSIISKQSTEVDAVSGATLSSAAIKKAVDQALSQAKGEAVVTEETTEEVPEETGKQSVSQWKDGTYSYESPEFDENGFKDQVAMTIKGNTITSLTWDCIKEDGTKKSKLSMDGKYIMTENGPKWHEQAESVVNYVLDHQGVDGLMKADGYTDSVASVSINLHGFVNGVKGCLSQASGESGEAKSSLKDGTYSYESPEFDENGFKDQVEMTIKENAITSLTWDCVKEDGTKKSKLSMDGKYVMTENGPKWHEQAESVVDYVLEHQGVDGLMKADGYTDSVASVSINLHGFVNGVKDCLSQASGESGETKSALKDGTYSYEASEFDENGFKDQVEMTIKENAITSLTWDCVKEDGTKKSKLSLDGKYVMTESGPKWHEQAESVVNYVLEHQGVDGLMKADGYTDSVASVSINLHGFVNGVKDCLTQASK
jgi:major membrane immunogen (membrane-anchored lipoprotein)